MCYVYITLYQVPMHSVENTSEITLLKAIVDAASVHWLTILKGIMGYIPVNRFCELASFGILNAAVFSQL